jgi:hypothetical protein
MMRLIGVCAFAAGLGIVSSGSRTATHVRTPLVVHEWGTITTNHRADGTPLGGLNRVPRYEPLADFVHRYEPFGVDTRGISVRVDTNVRRIPLQKTALGPPRADITMRLETPVIYFHPAPGASIAPFDVSVQFRGGVLNEYYPNGPASVNGWNGVHLSDSVVSSLRWSGVTLRDSAALPATTSRVWLAPRAVASTPVEIGGETEQYIFYRGTANLPALLQTQLTAHELILRSPKTMPWLTGASTSLGDAWVVDVRPNHTAAFRATGSLTLAPRDTSTVLARVADFAESDYSVTGLARLRDAMHAALVARGLFDDEASAMLETWKQSYFENPGLRVFYVVPNQWTSYYLPLTIGTPHELTRVIVGRIDIQAAPTP